MLQLAKGLSRHWNRVLRQTRQGPSSLHCALHYMSAFLCAAIASDVTQSWYNSAGRDGGSEPYLAPKVYLLSYLFI